MKASTVIASMLFGSLAAAAPLNKRAYATETHVVYETVVVYTTVWDGEAAATSTPGLFFEKTEDKPQPTTTSTYSPPANTQPAPTPEKVQPTTTSTSTTPTSTYTPPPTTHEPEHTTAPTTTAPTTTAAAPAQTSQSSGGSGEVHTGGSITMNYFSGGTGACGKPISDSDYAVALASDLFGPSTYDPATGNPTNKWCNVKVRIEYNGNSVDATILDRCEGCTGGGFDMTPVVWQKATGGVGGASGDRLQGAKWTVVG